MFSSHGSPPNSYLESAELRGEQRSLTGRFDASFISFHKRSVCVGVYLQSRARKERASFEIMIEIRQGFGSKIDTQRYKGVIVTWMYSLTKQWQRKNLNHMMGFMLELKSNDDFTF